MIFNDEENLFRSMFLYTTPFCYAISFYGLIDILTKFQHTFLRNQLNELIKQINKTSKVTYIHFSLKQVWSVHVLCQKNRTFLFDHFIDKHITRTKYHEGDIFRFYRKFKQFCNHSAP